MATLMVIGGSGLLGSKIARGALARYDVVASYRTAAPRVEGVRAVELQKETPEKATAILRDAGPDVVVDTAAFHDVDRCEESPDLAFQVNAAATGSLALAARDVGARYVYVSTDFVFDGARGPYREADVPRPVNQYGATKLAGERACLEADPDNQVVRSSVIYGWNDTRLNFATWLLVSLRDRKPVRVVTDWYGSPTFADSLSRAILRLLEIGDGGVFHLAAAECVSRYEFARRLAEGFGLDAGLIRPVSSSELETKATRPAHSCLVNERAARHGIRVAGVEEGIVAMRDQRTIESFVPPARFKS